MTMIKLAKILLPLLIIILSAFNCHGQSYEPPGSGYFEAVSDSNNIYYILKTFTDDTDKKWHFSIFFADSSDPQAPLLLSKYPDSPRFFICHDSKAVAFFNNGTCLGYNNNGQKTTFQSLPKNNLPLDAISVNNSIFLLTISNGHYKVYHLENSQWQLQSTLPGDVSDKVLNPRLFYYEQKIYLAGITAAGTLVCDSIENNELTGLDISLDENRRLLSIEAIINVNRTTLFVLRTDSYQPQFVTATFINNNFTNKKDLSANSLPDIGSRKFSFISCKSDMMLAVYKQKQIYLQKYSLDGAAIDKPVESYILNTEDSFNNIYLQIIVYLCSLIVAATIIIKFKKAVTGGPIPNTALGKPCPITLRLPAFIIDMFCMSIFMEGVMYILDKINLINKEQIVKTMAYSQNQLNTTGTINIDIQQLTILLVTFCTVLLLYFTIFEWLLALTPGKAVFGIKVADYDTLAPVKNNSFIRILIRNGYRVLELLSVFALITLPLILIVMTLSPRRQRPGDMVANTTVILARTNKKNTGQNIDQQA